MRAVLIVLTLLAAALPAAAQQPPRPDTTLTPEQRALERLRALGSVAEPDSVRAPGDTVGPQRVSVQPRGRQARGAAPGGIERDSIMQLLSRLEGYVGTEYRGEQARFNADSSRLVLRGNALVAREGNQLSADTSITYDERLALACGYGQPVLQGAGMTNPVVSDTVCYDIRRQMGRAPGATTRLEEGALWNVRCDAYFMGDNLYCHDAIFTDCDLPHPHQHYHFSAAQLKVVRGNVLVARDLTLNFADVPVMWLPFMVQSLSSGRRSGILMPRFGINDIARNSSRYNRRIEDVGVYWAISEYMGAELALDWFANNWTGLRGSMDYNWQRRFLRGGLTYRHFWREEGGTEFTLSSRNSWQMDERTNINATANYSTSSQFVRSRSLDPRELNRSIDSYGSIRRRFDWGDLSLGLSRKQFLSDNTVTTQLPNLNLNISPLTLFEAQPGEESWYSNATWSGSTTFRIDRRGVGAENRNLRAQSTRDLSTSTNTSLSLGNLSIQQRLDFREETREARELPGDSLPALPGRSAERGTWRTNLTYQQRLIGTSTFSPGVGISGDFIRSDSTGSSFVSAPTRIDFNAAVRTDVFGFWPGAGPFARMRHRLSPSIQYSYSPEARADSLQRSLFGRVGGDERNRISIGLNQTFEAKYRGVEVDSAAVADTTPAAGGVESGPRRRQQTQTVTLLSLSTDALVYDFVEAREGDGIVTTQISNSVTSDLLRGLQVNFTHDLFRTEDSGVDTQVPGARSFAPHLSRVSASFSLNNNSWLFRILRLGARDTMPDTGGDMPIHTEDVMDAGPAVDRTEPEGGLIGGSRRDAPGMPRGAVGAWNASFDYTLARPRETLDSREANQMLNGRFSFQPTVNWALNWNTGYSFSTGEFTDHRLTLTRTLHDWDANFDFVKAQNGNFSFVFRVHLRANPDIKLDYTQSDIPSLDRPGLRR